MSFRICMTALMVLTVFIFTVKGYSQDTGIADTIRLETVSGESGYDISMPVYLFNDEEISEIVIPLVIDGYAGWLRFDSVSYLGGRLANPAILNLRESDIFGTDSFTVDSLVLRFTGSSSHTLPAGAGKLCNLWFRLLYGGEVSIDSLPESPYGGLRIADSSGQEFIPQFQSGMIDILCNYLIGDINQDGSASTADANCIIKMYYFGQLCGMDIDEVAGFADINCDRHLDMRDAIIFLNYIFLGAGSLCDCGTYSPALYDDPGLPDTIWMDNDTIIAGFYSQFDVAIINDEPLSSFVVAIEWDTDVIMDPDYHWNLVEFTDRVLLLGTVQFEQSINSVYFTAIAYPGISAENLPIGFEAIGRFTMPPISAGEVTFHLTKYWGKYESMLTTDETGGLPPAAILPVFAGGHITVLPACGNLNGDASVNISDAIYLINYIFLGGDPPDPLECGNVNCDTKVNITDAVYIIMFVFSGGHEPCDPNGDGIFDCYQ